MPSMTPQEILKLAMLKMIGAGAKDWSWDDLEEWGKGTKKLSQNRPARTYASESTAEVDRRVRDYMVEHNISDDQYEATLTRLLRDDPEIKEMYTRHLGPQR